MRRVPLRRLCVVTALLAAPTVLLVVALAWGGVLGWSTGFLAAVAVAGILAVIVHRHVAGLEVLRRQIEQMTDDQPPERVSGKTSGIAAELAAALVGLNRKWRLRSEELKAAAAVNAAILDAIPAPIILLDAGRRIRRANAAARELLGEGIIEREIEGVLRDPGVLEMIDAVQAGQEPRAASFSIPGPVERYFEARAARLPAEAGSGTAILLALYDVTAIRRAEQMRADFVANVSHELRTPLATLVGFIETLRGPARDDPAAQDRFLGIMHDQATRMSRLVRDLLSLSRIEENEHTLPTGQVSIGPLIGTVVEALLLQARAKNMSIVTDIAADVPMITGDADQLAQVFQNLIDNAIKYGRPETSVRITAQLVQRRTGRAGVAAPFVAVAVADEGEGIPREHLPRLTERFYRVDAGRSRQLGGTGLGLAIVKHIVNRHRGALTIDSELGRGSVFTVYLPASPSAPSASPPAGA